MNQSFSPFELFEIGELVGQSVDICRFKFPSSPQSEGFVIVGLFNQFFIRVARTVNSSESESEQLEIKSFRNFEVEDGLLYHSILTGVLKETRLLKKDLPLYQSETESALLLIFEDGKSALISYSDQLQQTSIDFENQSIVNVISDERLLYSRSAVADVSLIQW